MEEQVAASLLDNYLNFIYRTCLTEASCGSESRDVHSVLMNRRFCKKRIGTLKTAYRDSYRQPGDMKTHESRNNDRKIKRRTNTCSRRGCEKGDSHCDATQMREDRASGMTPARGQANKGAGRMPWH